jgi:hypothetical protein
MKTQIISFITVVCLVFGAKNASAQAISFYPFRDILSIATNPSRPIWADFRVQTNSLTSGFNTETALMVNLAYTRNANIYAGAGTNFGIVGAIKDNNSLIIGYMGALGIRAYPFEKLPAVSCNFELSPYVNPQGEGGRLRAWLGVGYNFGKKK